MVFLSADATGTRRDTRDLSRFRPKATCRAATLVLAIAWVNSIAAGASGQVDEYRVKAAFLYNFAKFVEWPSGAFQTSNESISICVLGPDPFGRSLEDTLTGRQIEGRKLAVRNISNIKQVANCHILFVSSAGNPHSLPTLREIGTPGILTVGESDTAIAQGAVINFIMEGTRVRFEINLGAADREQLRISSKLLSLARVVGAAGKS
jgi:hypothetical protein